MEKPKASKNFKGKAFQTLYSILCHNYNDSCARAWLLKGTGKADRLNLAEDKIPVVGWGVQCSIQALDQLRTTTAFSLSCQDDFTFDIALSCSLLWEY